MNFIVWTKTTTTTKNSFVFHSGKKVEVWYDMMEYGDHLVISLLQDNSDFAGQCRTRV